MVRECGSMAEANSTQIIHIETMLRMRPLYLVYVDLLNFNTGLKVDSESDSLISKTWFELFVAFVNLCILLFSKSTCDMALMWLHVDSVLICTIKSQSSHIETNTYGMSKFFAGTKKNYVLSKNVLCSTKSFSA